MAVRDRVFFDGDLSEQQKILNSPTLLLRVLVQLLPVWYFLKLSAHLEGRVHLQFSIFYSDGISRHDREQYSPVNFGPASPQKLQHEESHRVH